MDSNSNSSEPCFPKLEIDSEIDSPRRDSKLNCHWTSENTMKLIEILERDCKELWDVKHPLIRDKNARQARYEYLANIFGTTAEEINRKIHNLRTQLNNELRKIKRRQATAGADRSVGGSGWEYFEPLSFLLRAPSGDPLETVDGVNLAKIYVVNMNRRKKLSKDEALLRKRIAERKRYEKIKANPQRYEIQRMKDRQKRFKRKLRAQMPTSEVSSEEIQTGINISERSHQIEDFISSKENNLEQNQIQEIISREGIISSNVMIKLDPLQDDYSDASMSLESDNLLAEFQADEEEEFGVIARAQHSTANSSSSSRGRPKYGHRVAASAPPAIQPSPHALIWTGQEEPVPRLRPGLNADECQIFGDFVASELRTLRSDESRKKLKRIIQKAILKIGEEEDVNIFNE